MRTSNQFINTFLLFVGIGVFLLSIVSVQANPFAGCGEAKIVGCSFSFPAKSAPMILSLTPPNKNIAAGELNGKTVVKVISPTKSVDSPAFEVSISVNGKVLPGKYRLSQAQMNGMTQNQAAADSDDAFRKMKKILEAQQQCPSAGQGIPIALSQQEQPQLPPQQAVNRLNEQRYAHRTTDDPEERKRHEEQREERRREVEQGNAPIAAGRTIAVGSGTGLINMRGDDPNGSNATPECDSLRVTPEEASESESFSNDSLKSCISAIQAKLMRGFDSPAHPKFRNDIFRRLFELPNEEQEFAAALFTLAGETNANEKPMDRLMILKVLSNRRNNGNEIEDEIKACRSNHSESSAQMECISEAQKDSKFNLLDLALDTHQFSMYNDCKNEYGEYSEIANMSSSAARKHCTEKGGVEANWYNNLGNTSHNFSSEIDIFMKYESLKEITMHGEGEHADIERIYHYVTPSHYPRTSWATKQPNKISVSATTTDDEELEMTSAHYFFYNVDTFGSPNGDGLARKPRHNFRRF